MMSFSDCKLKCTWAAAIWYNIVSILFNDHIKAYITFQVDVGPTLNQKSGDFQMSLGGCKQERRRASFI